MYLRIKTSILTNLMSGSTNPPYLILRALHPSSPDFKKKTQQKNFKYGGFVKLDIWCGVATISRLPKMIGLFCKRDL